MVKNFTLLVPIGAFLLLLLACRHGPPCIDLHGRWTTREGQEFLFLENGRGLWLTHFGSLFDTVRFVYVLNCRQKPFTLDLSQIDDGPYSGKTLFGIVAWVNDTSLRWQYEAGPAPEIRPKAFEGEQTQLLFREQSMFVPGR